VRHGPWDWHLHGVATDASPATRIVVDTAMAMIDVVRDDQLSRFGICADEHCTGIVLDLSRNRSRRFCSTACGNRNAVAAYRARQAKD
jgi:predicted RNA-binding Zn ribbon-like protein